MMRLARSGKEECLPSKDERFSALARVRLARRPKSLSSRWRLRMYLESSCARPRGSLSFAGLPEPLKRRAGTMGWGTKWASEKVEGARRAVVDAEQRLAKAQDAIAKRCRGFAGRAGSQERQAQAQAGRAAGGRVGSRKGRCVGAGAGDGWAHNRGSVAQANRRRVGG